MSDPTDGPAVLRAVREKRGYLLSYHRMLAAHAPELLTAYDAYYERLTLRQRHLDPVEKELTWIALQVVTREAHGAIHLRRAEAAGIDRATMADAVAIAGAAEGIVALGFAAGHWGAWVDRAAAEARYLRLFEAARGAAPARAAEIAAVVCHAACRTYDGMALHLPRAIAAGATPAMLAEGLSFLLLPAGGPCLIDAVEAWARIAADGRCPPPYPPEP